MDTIIRMVLGFLILFLSSCGIKTYRTFEPVSDNIVIKDSKIHCDFSSVIFDVDNTANIYIYFSTLQKPYEIIKIHGKVDWSADEKVVNNSMTLMRTSVVNLNINKNHSFDSTFHNIDSIPLKYKSINDSIKLTYSMEFQDTLHLIIPANINKMRFMITFEVKIENKIETYYKDIDFVAKKHHYFWFLRDD